MSEIKYWPFEVLPADKQSAHHREVIRFLDEALSDGFQPYVFDNSNYGATAGSERVGELIHRGVNRYWEVFLRLGDEVACTFYVDGFLPASQAILEWLRGQEAILVAERIRDHVIPAPGFRRG